MSVKDRQVREMLVSRMVHLFTLFITAGGKAVLEYTDQQQGRCAEEFSWRNSWQEVKSSIEEKLDRGCTDLRLIRARIGWSKDL